MNMKVGGQALPNGVMFRNYDSISAAAIAYNGVIETIIVKYNPLARKKIFSFPIIRGVIDFPQIIYLGIKTNLWAINVALPLRVGKDKQKYSFLELTTALSSMLITIIVLLSVPYLITEMLDSIRDSPFLYNFIRKIVQLFFTFSFFYVTFRLYEKYFKAGNLTQYHGAEHKVINAYENNSELTVENISKYSIVHERCGTNFTYITILFGILFYGLIDSLYIVYYGNYETVFSRVGIHLLFLPLSIGLGYEVFKIANINHKYNLLKKMNTKLGLLFQKITVKEPNTSQIEIALVSFKLLLEEYGNKKS